MTIKEFNKKYQNWEIIQNAESIILIRKYKKDLSEGRNAVIVTAWGIMLNDVKVPKNIMKLFQEAID